MAEMNIARSESRVTMVGERFEKKSGGAERIRDGKMLRKRERERERERGSGKKR